MPLKLHETWLAKFVFQNTNYIENLIEIQAQNTNSKYILKTSKIQVRPVYNLHNVF